MLRSPALPPWKEHASAFHFSAAAIPPLMQAKLDEGDKVKVEYETKVEEDDKEESKEIKYVI